MKLNINIPDKRYYKTDFAVLRLDNEAPEFISNLSTNTADASQNTFLDINGKIVAFTFQKVSGDRVYLLVRKPFDNVLEKHLSKYLRIGPTKLERIDTDVYHIFSKDAPCDQEIHLSAGYLCWEMEKKKLDKFSQMSDEEYLLIRIAHKIPLQGIEFENPMLLEINQDEALAQNKGCYLGQEIIARVLSRGKAPRVLRRLAFKFEPRQISSNSKKAGEIKSMVYSKSHNLWAVFAMVNKGIDYIDGGEFLD